MDTTAPIPVTVIGGYLGVGKTTLVNRLLRQAGGLRLAVLVNDFGALPIDADLIEGRDGDVLALAGGCICCSYGSELVAALIDLGRRASQIDHVVIETSGVSLPGSVAQSISLVGALRLDGVAVLLDAETVRERAEDLYLADTIARQIADADLLLLNKIDLVDATTRAELLDWLRSRWPASRVTPCARGDLPIELVLGRQPPRPSTAQRDAVSAEVLYESVSLRLGTTMPADAIASILTRSTPGLLRAKGFVFGAAGQCTTIQVVGARHELGPAPHAIAGPGRLACIGLRGVFDPARLSLALQLEPNTGFGG
jgi:G3E family GTPase